MSFSSKGTVHRSTVTGRRGMIASAHPLASLAGVRMLMQEEMPLTPLLPQRRP